MKSETLILQARTALHHRLLGIVSTEDTKASPSLAGSRNEVSTRIAASLLQRTGTTRSVDRLQDQTADIQLEHACAEFLKATFLKLDHLRPGQWTVYCMGQSDQAGIANFEQYARFSAIYAARKTAPELASVLGTDYMISPDVVVLRAPEPDEVINSRDCLVGPTVAVHAPLRKANSEMALIHASISCKMTLRSDRAQNARSEALNLIRNRKGRVPHVVVVTAEPLPSRLASLALGTGDLDCVYHFALPELQAAVKEEGSDDSAEMLKIMIDGKRLRDISDLPLDLAV